jgi:hypothetical protein
MNQQGTFLSDGGDTVRDLQLYLNPQAEHLDVSRLLTAARAPSARGVPRAFRFHGSPAPEGVNSFLRVCPTVSPRQRAHPFMALSHPNLPPILFGTRLVRKRSAPSPLVGEGWNGGEKRGSRR